MFIVILEPCARACTRVCVCLRVPHGHECACVHVCTCVCVRAVSVAPCGCVLSTLQARVVRRQSWSPGPFPGPG